MSRKPYTPPAITSQALPRCEYHGDQLALFRAEVPAIARTLKLCAACLAELQSATSAVVKVEPIDPIPLPPDPRQLKL